jgi:predicted small lipoprotein YifL
MRNHCRARSRFTVLPLAMTAALALAMLGGCGIKGPLKLPPPAPASGPASSSSGAKSSPSGAPPSPTETPTPAPEALPAEPPAVPAEPRKP